MAERTRPSYLPAELSEEIRRWAPAELSGSEVYELTRLAERFYARGYDDGHRAGWQEGYDYHKRPDTNEVNRLREALAHPEGETT